MQVLRKYHKQIKQAPRVFNWLCLLSVAYAAWLNFALRNSEVPRYVWNIGGQQIGTPKACFSYLSFGLFFSICAKALNFYLYRWQKADRVFLLNHSGVTWKVKDLVAQNKEGDATQFLRKQYNLTLDEARTMIQKIRLGIDITQRAEEDSSIDLMNEEAEKTNPNIEEIRASQAQFAKKQIVIPPDLARKAKELIRNGRTHEAMMLLRQNEDLDAETARRVIEKLRKIG